MPIVASGAAADVPAIREAAEKYTELLGDRIKTATVLLQTANVMPERTDGGVSYGYWKAGNVRQIWLWEKFDHYPIEKTLAHEAMHVVDSDWLTPEQRALIINLMDPPPNGWKDQVIRGVKRIYKGLPFESFAVYASAAIGGFDKPAYQKLFKREIDPAKWSDLRKLTLRREDPPIGRGSGPTPDENIPVPPDTEEELTEALAATEALLTEANGVAVAAEIRRDIAEGTLLQAKSKAAELRQILGTGDFLTAMEKAAEIEAL